MIKKQRKLKYIVISFILTILILLPLRKYIQIEKNIQIILNINLKKDIELQIFYTQDINKNFNEADSIKKDIKKEEAKVIIDLKNIKKLEKLRMDFGKYPENIEISSIKILGDKEKIFFPKDIIKYSKNQIEKSYLENNKLILFSNELDPFIIFSNEDIKIQNKTKTDLYLITTFFIIIFFTIYILINKIRIKKVKYKEKSWDKIYYIIIFIIILLFPSIKIDDKINDFRENRKLQEKSKLIKDGRLNLNFGKETEQWLNDHFHKRRQIIKIYEKINKKLIGRVENNSAFMGKDKWLFYKGDNSIINFQNINLYSEKELEKIEKNLKLRKEWLNNQGIKYYIFIAPDKNKIYGEYYPSYIQKINQYGRAQQLKDFLKSKEIEIVYPIAELLEKKKEGLLYYKTDTHWNSYGAFIGYQELMKKIKKDFSNITILDMKNCMLTEKNYNGGDLAGMLNVDLKLYQDIMYKEFIYDYTYKYLKNEGRNGVIVKSKKSLKVLMFRDSFTSAMEPYISESFGDVEYIWDHNFNNYQNKIITEKPDIVIHEIVERYIDVLKINSPVLIGGEK